LLAHTTNRVGIPKNFKGEHLKFGLKFMERVSSWNFIPRNVPRGMRDNVVINF